MTQTANQRLVDGLQFNASYTWAKSLDYNSRSLQDVVVLGSVERWFDTSIFTPLARFGNLGRNVVTGPGFDNTNFSVVKNTRHGEQIRTQFREEIFDLFNHTNLGQPGNVVGSPAFGRITNTRFQTGEAGSCVRCNLPFMKGLRTNTSSSAIS